LEVLAVLAPVVQAVSDWVVVPTTFRRYSSAYLHAIFSQWPLLESLLSLAARSDHTVPIVHPRMVVMADSGFVPLSRLHLEAALYLSDELLNVPHSLA
jgi:hypothetical protein